MLAFAKCVPSPPVLRSPLSPCGRRGAAPLPISLLPEAGFQKCQRDVDGRPHARSEPFCRFLPPRRAVPLRARSACSKFQLVIYGSPAVWLNPNSSFPAVHIHKLSGCCQEQRKRHLRAAGELWVLSAVPWQGYGRARTACLSWCLAPAQACSQEERSSEKMQNGSSC